MCSVLPEIVVTNKLGDLNGTYCLWESKSRERIHSNEIKGIQKSEDHVVLHY